MSQKTSKFISLILRHDPGCIGITLDANGWAKVNELLAGMAKKGHVLSEQDLLDIVKADEKGRYKMSEDGSHIQYIFYLYEHIYQV